MTLAWSSVVAASSLYAVVGPSLADEDQSGANKTVAESVSPRVRLFSDGIWIDWRHREVALEAKVVLRKGPLELLACSPNTREHESILVVLARPRDIYHAMGLIGLEPGSPVRFDSQKQHVLPPTGEPLHLRIRYEEDGLERTVSASAWLRCPSSEKRIANVAWVFAGSYSTSGGRFAGDAEGTIVALVDFESALIAVGALHTPDNDALWLEAGTDAIPPVGTPCRLMISAAVRRLEVLMGRYPSGHYPLGTDLPAMPSAVPGGLPSELVHRRPDLFALELQLLEADTRIAQAQADLRPRFSLTSGAGTSSDSLLDLLDKDLFIWNFVGSLPLQAS